MAIKLLRRLAAGPLPLLVDGQTDIHTLEVLVLAGQAKATVPPNVRKLAGNFRPPATVHEITRMGFTALERFANAR